MVQEINLVKLLVGNKKGILKVIVAITFALTPYVGDRFPHTSCEN